MASEGQGERRGGGSRDCAVGSPTPRLPVAVLVRSLGTSSEGTTRYDQQPEASARWCGRAARARARRGGGPTGHHRLWPGGERRRRPDSGRQHQHRRDGRGCVHEGRRYLYPRSPRAVLWAVGRTRRPPDRIHAADQTDFALRRIGHAGLRAHHGAHGPHRHRHDGPRRRGAEEHPRYVTAAAEHRRHYPGSGRQRDALAAGQGLRRRRHRLGHEGGSTHVVIRGANSISGDNTPLVRGGWRADREGRYWRHCKPRGWWCRPDGGLGLRKCRSTT